MTVIPTYIFVVPYRDREPHKVFFETYMEKILEDYDKSSYEILFVHQNNKLSFNRGAMKNIGFMYIKEKYPDDYKNIIFVFNDVDTIPYKKGLLDYRVKHGEIKHFYGHKFALGGIISVRGKDFETLNGFPNYWTWGFEDNILNHRAKQKKININRNIFYPIMSMEILHFFDELNKKIDKENIKNQYDPRFKENDGLTFIKNLQYTFNNNTNMLDVNSFQSKYSPFNRKIISHNILHGSTIPNPSRRRKSSMAMLIKKNRA